MIDGRLVGQEFEVPALDGEYLVAAGQAESLDADAADDEPQPAKKTPAKRRGHA